MIFHATVEGHTQRIAEPQAPQPRISRAAFTEPFT
jgi:hypothetical protein